MIPLISAMIEQRNRPKLFARRGLVACFTLGFVVAACGATFNVPNPASLSLERSTGSIRIYYEGQVNFQYMLLASSNAFSWSPVLTNMATAARMTYIDTQASNRQARFYKASSLKTGFIYQGAFAGADTGGFMLFARTNNVGTFLGYNTRAGALGGERATGISIAPDGNFCARLIGEGNACGTFSGATVSGNFTNSANGRGTFSGNQKSNGGAFRFSAGFYRGTYSGSCAGNLEAIIAADGTMILYQASSSSDNDAGMVTIAGNGSFTVATPKGQHFTGTLNSVNLIMSGSYIHGCNSEGFGTFSLSRVEKVN